jgi:prolyl 4-hydroxylase
MLTPYEHNDLDNFIAGWYINPDLCDTIVDYFESNRDCFWRDDHNGCDVTFLDSLPEELYAQYIEEMFKVVELYKEKYPLVYKNLYPWHMTPPMMHRYAIGDAFYRAHCEDDGSPNPEVENRHLSLMTYFKDIDNGGGTYFHNQNLTTPSKKGLTVMFPAAWTHWHNGVVSNTDVKYLTTSFGKFNR